MADRTDNVLLAAIRSLEQVVAPAVGDDNPLAKEQVGLVAAHLRFLRDRLPLQYERSHYELDYYLRLGHAVADALAEHQLFDAALDAALTAGASVDEHREPTPRELEDAAAALRGALSRVVRGLGVSSGEEPEVGRAVERAVLDAAEPILDFQRAWFLPQGWDPDEAAVPPLEGLLARRTGGIESSP